MNARIRDSTDLGDDLLEGVWSPFQYPANGFVSTPVMNSAVLSAFFGAWHPLTVDVAYAHASTPRCLRYARSQHHQITRVSRSSPFPG